MLRKHPACCSFDLVESVHRGNDAFVNRTFHRVRRARDCRSHEGFLLFEKIAEHIIARCFGRRVTNSKWESRHFFRAKLGDDRFQSVMSAGPPTLTNPQSPEWQ